MAISVEIIEQYERKGYRMVKITADGAVNTPILKFPLAPHERKTKPVKVAGPVRRRETRCSIFPNHSLRKDGTCERGESGLCNCYRKKCPAA